MSSLNIGKAIYDLLKDVQPGKVFPLVADEGTTYPFIVYRRSAVNPSDSKDRYNYQESVTIEILVADNNYNGSVVLAEAVRKKLEHARGNANGVLVTDTFLTGADEQYLEDAFIQKLIFEFQVKQ